MSFDALAPHYRWMEWLLAGEKLQRCRTAFLHMVPKPTSILLLGEGNGRFLPACAKRWERAHITCVDASAAMIVQAYDRLIASGIDCARVSFVHSDVLTWEPPKDVNYDLVVTNFFLDCFAVDELKGIIRRVSGASTRRANWLLADFQQAAGGPARIRSRLILGLMYAFFRATTRVSARGLVPPDDYLKSASFTLRRRIQTEWGLLRSDWWQRSH